MKPKTLAAPVAFALLVTLLSWRAMDSWQARPAPQVTFQTVAGQSFATADLRGKVVLVNFWSVSCAPCLAEMPDIAATYQKFEQRGLRTVAVAMRYDAPSHVAGYAARERLAFDVSFDPVGQLAESFGGVAATPTSFVIDRRGSIVARYVGPLSVAKLNALLERLLDEPA
ncbi:MAG: TlpA family protein disulfide reductase [Rhodocyclaceae bacterium]|nr:TlpA family protein disulfide reductase [Rhodocyclaceae bacterium]MBX3669220.1 TlpA family protein disulfide reductase [Rhodocyclaceae bacterium]